MAPAGQQALKERPAGTNKLSMLGLNSRGQTTNVVPVLCVASWNVACNVGGGRMLARNINDLKSERSQLLVPTASIYGPSSFKLVMPLEKPSLLGPIQGPEILNKRRAGCHLLSHGTASSFYT
ncbi:hypothetical protein QVD17_29847 [Tagetes erecta]|uniref:Uncharacterized protein n=1 Tax=Tagetes erecta TaxID=13708 RepID=A0AAD8NMR6_TARER|nr:hypothetical protein QVD17_29847 [Tagetes erecta]